MWCVEERAEGLTSVEVAEGTGRGREREKCSSDCRMKAFTQVQASGYYIHPPPSFCFNGGPLGDFNGTLVTKLNYMIDI